MRDLSKYKKYFPVALFIAIILIIILTLILESGNPTQTPAKNKNTTSPRIQNIEDKEFLNSDVSPYPSTFIKTLPTLPQASQSSKVTTEKTSLKVGGEEIYQKDYDTELSYFPVKKDTAQIKKIIIDKEIIDSKILQIGEEEGIIKLDDSIYNSPEKDYLKRIDAVKKVKKVLQGKISSIRGTVVAIWFLNDHAGPLGYEKSKQIAYEKIKTLHDGVKSGQITITQAANQIINDNSLFTLDPNYKTNALLNFDTSVSTHITWEDDFNNNILQLEEGETTEIFTGKSFDFDHNGQKVDAYYLFGQVTYKPSIDQITNLDDWINDKSKNYEIIYYN